MDNHLQQYIQQQKTKQGILLMSHLVLGYPSLEENEQVVATMVKNGVDLIELQLPFSEPNADGPIIAAANQAALEAGFRLQDGLATIARLCQQFSIPFLIMSYYNILYRYGVKKFIDHVAQLGIKGCIVPDLPLQNAQEAMTLCQKNGIDWIQLMAPTCRDERLKEIGRQAQGFCYCVARRGVTGKQTQFGDEVGDFLSRCRQATSLPLAVGFGVKTASDVQYLSTMADIAVVGTAAIEIHKQHGVEAVGQFMAGLRP